MLKNCLDTGVQFSISRMSYSGKSCEIDSCEFNISKEKNDQDNTTLIVRGFDDFKLINSNFYKYGIIEISSNSNVMINQCGFNKCEYLDVGNNKNEYLDAKIDNCHFHDCKSPDQRSPLNICICHNSQNVKISNSQFINCFNDSESYINCGNAINVNHNGSKPESPCVQIKNCTFKNCKSISNSGAISDLNEFSGWLGFTKEEVNCATINSDCKFIDCDKRLITNSQN